MKLILACIFLLPVAALGCCLSYAFITSVDALFWYIILGVLSTAIGIQLLEDALGPS